jgi:mRNA interferase RelE/StbE
VKIDRLVSFITILLIAIGIRKEGDKKDIYQLMKKYLKTGLLEPE